MKITVCIRDRQIYEKYKTFYDEYEGLSIVYGNIFNYQADCFVTAGQSFGMCDGGIDGDVNYFFGFIEERVQKELMDKWRRRFRCRLVQAP